MVEDSVEDDVEEVSCENDEIPVLDEDAEGIFNSFGDGHVPNVEPDLEESTAEPEEAVLPVFKEARRSSTKLTKEERYALIAAAVERNKGRKKKSHGHMRKVRK